MGYDHTQRAPLHLVLWAAALALAFAAWWARRQEDIPLALGAVAGVLALVALAFAYLRVRDVGDALELRYGPLPLMRKRVPYAAMRAVRPARSLIVDGWGVHWVPGRGWTWNLWGRDCVEIDTDRGRLRVGTDDREGLVAFLRARCGEAAP